MTINGLTTGVTDTLTPVTVTVSEDGVYSFQVGRRLLAGLPACLTGIR